MIVRKLALLGALCISAGADADNSPAFDAATAFGARPSISDVSLSPDGKSAAYVSPLVTWDKLDHQLDDAAAREKMLRKSDEWLHQAFAMIQ